MARVAALLALLSVATLTECGVVKEIGKSGYKTGVGAIGTGLNAVSAVCEDVKHIAGVDYEQIAGEKEPDLNKLKLILETDNSSMSYPINSAAEEIHKSKEYNTEKKMVIFVHGFLDDPSKNSFRKISEAFLERGGYNVLALDGSSLIMWLYLRASTYVRFIGEKLGTLLATNVRASSLKPSDILIAGHSLGSHIAGFAGKTFHNLTGTKIGRISGLDPAGPCFTNVDEDLKLKNTDADYVDVMHTDAKVYGLREPLGHTDYYVNGGSMQPSCFLQTCNHNRAWLYYSESVLYEDAFPAKKCKNWETFENFECGDTEISYMGFASTPQTRGIFYLRTNGDSPFRLKEKGLRPLLKSERETQKLSAEKVKKEIEDLGDSVRRGGLIAGAEEEFYKI